VSGALDWEPVATVETIRLRAELLTRIREYFAREGVLEVETPTLSVAGTTDPAIESFLVADSSTPRYLHTSPEFPMKRLLAAGLGSIFQLCKVFRKAESGRLHNTEFTLLEWYRVGFDHVDLMDDVERLLHFLLPRQAATLTANHWTYRDLFLEFAGFDPFTASPEEIAAILENEHGVEVAGLGHEHVDAWLDLAMTHVVEPHMDDGLMFVRDYPASQASLARLQAGSSFATAARFEVYLDGIELANGFYELTDADELARRFNQDNQVREQQGQSLVTIDSRLLTAMAHGLPDCAGVALGVDRLLMIAAGADSIKDVIAFPDEIA